MKPVTAVILGAGSRGCSYGAYAAEYPDQLQVVAIAEPRADRREQLARQLHVPEEMCFSSWQELRNRPKMADCAFVCTLDDDHTAPAVQAMEKGYHLLLEKPMSNREDECRAIAAAAVGAVLFPVKEDA